MKGLLGISIPPINTRTVAVEPVTFAIRSCVSKPTLFYQVSQNVVFNWLLGSAIISVKLVLTLFDL